jgi:hypothetical protein
VRKLFAVLTLVAGAYSRGQAQQAWHTEFGIQGGYTRIKPAGTGANDHIDLFGVPGFDLPGVLPSNAALFAILPWKDKIAIELGASASQGNAIAILGDATFFTFDARANYAITPKFYGALGGALNWVEAGGESETQLGVQAGVGYRFPFVAGLRGRVEANALFVAKADLLSATNSYSVMFGVSKELGGRARGAAPARRATGRAWQPMFGVQGGYYRTHAVGGSADLTGISLPGAGGGLSILGTPIGAPPTLFAVLPIGRKIAIEPGVDLRRFQSGGTTAFGGNVAARFDYAVTGGWYGAVGGNLLYVKATGADAETITGANLGWGYRFPLTSGLGGRFELNYTMMGKNETLGVPPLNTMGLQFAVTMPLR